MKFFIVTLALLAALDSNVLAILNGKNAGVNQYPFMARIRAILPNDDYMDCTGTIVSKMHILTAAECVIDSIGYEIYLGSKSRDEFALPMTLPGFQGTCHNDYERDTKANNIAILKLVQRLEFNDEIDKISWPESGHDSAGVVIGFGNERPKKLQYASVNLVDKSECKDLQDNEFCAQGKGGPCVGDAGAPLVMLHGNEYKQIGMFSQQKENCKTSNAYIDLSSYDQWLKQKTFIY